MNALGQYPAVGIKADSFRFQETAFLPNLFPFPLSGETAHGEVSRHDSMARHLGSKRIPPQRLTNRLGRTAIQRLREPAVGGHFPFRDGAGRFEYSALEGCGRTSGITHFITRFRWTETRFKSDSDPDVRRRDFLA